MHDTRKAQAISVRTRLIQFCFDYMCTFKRFLVNAFVSAKTLLHVTCRHLLFKTKQFHLIKILRFLIPHIYLEARERYNFSYKIPQTFKAFYHELL